MNNFDKNKLIVRIISGILLGIMVLAGSGTLIYYLIRG